MDFVLGSLLLPSGAKRALFLNSLSLKIVARFRFMQLQPIPSSSKSEIEEDEHLFASYIQMGRTEGDHPRLAFRLQIERQKSLAPKSHAI